MENKVIDKDSYYEIELKNRTGRFCGLVKIDKEDISMVKGQSWWITPKGYAAANIKILNRRTVFMHRALVAVPEGLMLDHINGDRLDNRRDNLRLVTNSQNSLNRKNAKCYYRRKNDSRWTACLKIDGKHVYLGRFDTEEEAQEAVSKGREEHVNFDYALA